MKVAILGAGNAGCTIAGYLKSLGHEIRLFDLPQFSGVLENIRKRGGIHLAGEYVGTYSPDLLTTDIREAVDGAEIAMLTVPAYGHEAFMDACLPYFAENQVLLNWTSYWSALRFFPIARRIGRSDLILGEAAIMPYMANAETQNEVIFVRAVKQQLWVAAMPAASTHKVMQVVRELYPQAIGVENVLRTSLGNVNVPFHVATWLMSASHWEQTAGDFDFYGYGITPSVGRLADAIDMERLAVANALGVNTASFPKLMSMIYAKYGAAGDTAYDVLHTLRSHATWRPKVGFINYAERDVLEDVPFGLVPLSSLGNQLGVPTPTIDSVVQVASVIAGKDFRSTGISAEKLGVKGMTQSEIIHYVTYGHP